MAIRRNMTSTLETLLHDFDGNSVSMLSEARAKCSKQPGYLDELVRLCAHPQAEISNGATWILKAEVDDGFRLDTQHVDTIARALKHLSSWQAHLHICQAIDGFLLTESQVNSFIDWASSLADHPRPFVRAWALHVVVCLGMQFDRFRHLPQQALDRAKDDRAASVRARARNLIKKFGLAQ